MKENKWGGCSHEQGANSVYFAANFFGNAAFGPFADSFGRQKGMIVSLGVSAFGGSLAIMGMHVCGVFTCVRVYVCLWYVCVWSACVNAWFECEMYLRCFCACVFVASKWP